MNLKNNLQINTWKHYSRCSINVLGYFFAVINLPTK
jgi:hypothetical protein